jgi:hypothetical protein
LELDQAPWEGLFPATLCFWWGRGGESGAGVRGKAGFGVGEEKMNDAAKTKTWESGKAEAKETCVGRG